MELTVSLVQGAIKTGGEMFQLNAGEKVRIQKKLTDDEWTDVLPACDPPNGKRWEVNASIYVLEYDV